MEFSNSGKPEPEERQHASAALKRALFITIIVVFALITGAYRTISIIFASQPELNLTMFFATKQDIPVGAATLLGLGALLLAAGNPRFPALSPARLRISGLAAIALIAAPALIAFVLRQYVFPDYDLSRDEQMVTYDAAIFSAGKLFEPVPPFWRDYYHALNSTFLLPVGDRAGFVSAYLPGNAALHALIGTMLPASAASPLLLLIGTIALWRIAVQLWPDSPSTRAVVLLVFATSSQIIVTATATYAMTAHLALNCVWLCLFLKRRPAAHAAAIAVGFVATGLHQPLFHPFFVAPFLLLLLRERAWKELAAYVLCYGVIGLFWLGWQPWLSAHGVAPVLAGHGSGGVGYLDRLRDAIHPLEPAGIWVMAANLLRFVTWNHLLLLPLAGLAMFGTRRGDPFVQALWIGAAMVIVFMTIMLPAQVNGWGYRYLHGFLGNAALLAGIGWHRLERDGAAPVRSFAWLTALGAVVILPLHAWMAGGQLWGYASARANIVAINADIVIVDEGVPFSGDLVLNRADLSNRPILLSRSELTTKDIPVLCKGRTIAFADAQLLGSVSAYFGIPVPIRSTAWQATLKDSALAAGCRVIAPPVALPPVGGGQLE